MKNFFKKKNANPITVDIPIRPLTIAIDFDGTCVEHKYPDIGKEMPGASQTLRSLALREHRLILWTCREDFPDNPEAQYLSEAIQWFKEREIPLAGINKVPVEFDFRGEVGGRKPVFDMVIDDTNFGGFPGWPTIHYTLTGMPLI
ncbi:hypothetical protein LNTAR_18940 [Lentisphaera araneosa HTCC2155]|uniref:Hydrolase n=1 Tax=Lentisphaera araneosa HTCC2155 TaxID=313628 RepID=A6DNU4_9BACT|nr:hypothetical protein [Lentisphaera araneosa]EDM26753.1 hypothetical protein LNTAR_18940 [Lentisphaera araneosa HTCC2155]